MKKKFLTGFLIGLISVSLLSQNVVYANQTPSLENDNYIEAITAESYSARTNEIFFEYGGQVHSFNIYLEYVGWGFGNNYSPVLYAQIKLKMYFGGGVSITGTFNDSLSKKIIEFQKAKGVTADGIVGPTTWLLLNKVM